MFMFLEYNRTVWKWLLMTDEKEKEERMEELLAGFGEWSEEEADEVRERVRDLRKKMNRDLAKSIKEHGNIWSGEKAEQVRENIEIMREKTSLQTKI